jgi:hypothetical protein
MSASGTKSFLQLLEVGSVSANRKLSFIDEEAALHTRSQPNGNFPRTHSGHLVGDAPGIRGPCCGEVPAR